MDPFRRLVRDLTCPSYIVRSVALFMAIPSRGKWHSRADPGAGAECEARAGGGGEARWDRSANGASNLDMSRHAVDPIRSAPSIVFNRAPSIVYIDWLGIDKSLATPRPPQGVAPHRGE
ncbi:hypothetical protein GCM10022420_034310 [Streptomyces iranensis]